MRSAHIALVFAFVCSAAAAAAACGGSKFTAGAGEDAGAVDAQTDVPTDRTMGSDAPEDLGAETGSLDAGAGEARGTDTGGPPADARTDGEMDASSSDASACGSGYICVAAAPAGWSGPVELYTGSNPPPDCPPPYGTTVFEGGLGVVADPAACACGCGVDASTMRCGAAPVVYYNGGTGCTGSACYSDSIGLACQKSDPAPCTGTAQAIIGRPGTFGGSCAAWVDASAPPWSWTLGAIGCSADSPADAGGCAAGSLCAPMPVAPLCIYSDGGARGCPDAGQYTVSYVLYGGVDDTRACAACSCQPSGTCSGTLLNYNSDISCSGSTQGFSVDGGCITPYSALGGTYWSGSFGLQNPTCSTEGGAPTGTVTEKSPTTFCCTH